jgi:hypothetical protein
VFGKGCGSRALVRLYLSGIEIDDGHANRTGRFSIRAQAPDGTSEDAHRVSSRCHGRFVGSQLIEVVEPYPAPRSLLTLDRTAVPAGQAVTVRGSKCPTGRPLASLDGQPVNLHVDRGAKGKGFTAHRHHPVHGRPGPADAVGRLRRRLGRDHRTAGPGS